MEAETSRTDGGALYDELDRMRWLPHISSYQARAIETVLKENKRMHDLLDIVRFDYPREHARRKTIELLLEAGS